MRAIFATPILALAFGCHPAVAQPAVTLQAPCAPAAAEVARLKGEGYARIAKAVDVEGDPFAVYRKGDDEWRAISVIRTPDGAVWACSILGGDGMSVGDVGEGA